MSTLTRITKRARAKDKKQRRPFSLEEKHENFVENEATKVKENERQREK